MSSGSQILEEYLVSLGYKTDWVSLRKFDDGLSKTGKRVLTVGKTVAGVVLALEATAAAFAYNMRKVYFASELSGTTVKNLKAMQFAGEQFGISGDSMASAVHGMAQAMRLNPGLQGLVESFGVKVQGRDVSDVMLDFVAQLKRMPEFQAVQMAGMFGIDPDTYHQMVSHLDELKQKKQALLDQYSKTGYDPERAKQALLEYTEALDRLQLKAEAVGVTLVSRLAPAFKMSTELLESYLDRIGKLSNSQGWTAAGNNAVDLVNDLNPVRKAIQWLGKEMGFGKGTPQNAPTQAELMRSLEQGYGLPPGVLDRMWNAESSRGKNMLSPAGAKGHFGFMDETAKQYGVSDPNDFTQSAEGAAHYLSDLIQHYGGDVEKALAAYNWGPGNVDRKGVSAAPRETLGYLDKTAGRLGADGAGARSVSVSQTNTYHISGTGAQDTARAVERSQERVWGDVTRDMRSAVL